MNEIDWTQRAQDLRNVMENTKPTISISTVMQVFGYSSKGAAEYALQQLEKIGAVKQEGGRWYLTS
jgi:hypothetical protein